MVIHYAGVIYLWDFLLQGPVGARSLLKFKNQVDKFTWLTKALSHRQLIQMILKNVSMCLPSSYIHPRYLLLACAGDRAQAQGTFHLF